MSTSIMAQGETATQPPTWRDRALSRLGLVRGAERDRAVEVAYRHGYHDQGEDEPPSGTLAKYGYRRTTTNGLRDFSQIDRVSILEIVWTLWQSNPVADRAMEIKRDYILGKGISPKATGDEELQAILDDFWDINKMDKRTKEFVLQLFLFGVQCFPVFVRESDGQVRLGYIDPAEIEDVVTHPDNSLEMWAVITRERQALNPWEQNLKKRVFRIVRQDEGRASPFQDGPYSSKNWMADVLSTYGAEDTKRPLEDQAQPEPPDTKGRLVTHKQSQIEDWEKTMLAAFGLSEYSGDCFYYKVNSVSNQPHGYSDLLPVADWLDQDDETLFALADREQLAGLFSWDVKLTGSNSDQVKKRANEIRNRPPRKGSVNVHNDAEEWRFDFPDLKASSSIESERAIKTHAIGGLGYPEAWFGRGDETGRATAAAQADPTWKTLEHDQDIASDMFMEMLTFARDQAVIAGHYRQNEDGGEFTLPMPEMTQQDNSAAASTLGSVASANLVAEEQGWQTREESRDMWAKAAKEFGIEIDTSAKLPELEPGPEQAPGTSAVNRYGIAWPGDGETGEARSWSELTEGEQGAVLAAWLEQNGVRADRGVGEMVEAVREASGR